MAEPSQERPVRSAPRRRGVGLERPILQAAADELLESGYATMTIDRVARRAATNKNAIYRRWPSRLELGFAAYRLLVTAVETPDTGTLRSDAVQRLRDVNRHWQSPQGRVLRDLIVAAGGEPGLLAQLRGQPGR